MGGTDLHLLFPVCLTISSVSEIDNNMVELYKQILRKRTTT